MPKTINPPAYWTDTIEVPRDGEGIDAADLELPVGDTLGNTKFLRQALIDLSREVASLRAAQTSFVLTAPASLTAEPGRTYPVAVGINRQSGFTGAVDLDVQNLPAGVSATFDPDPASGSSSTLTLKAGVDAVPGRYDVLLTGTSGSVSSSSKVLLTVTAASLAPRFDMTTAGSAVVDRAAGKTATLPIDITRQGGFADAVQLSLVAPPSGISGTFSANPITGAAANQPAASTLTLAVGDSVPAGTYSINVRAASGSLVVTRAVSLTVTAQAQAGALNFYVSSFVLDDTSGALLGGGATLQIAREGGFTGPVLVRVSDPLAFGPIVLIDGQPWQATILGDTARVTLDWSGRGYDGGENAMRRIGAASIVPMTFSDGYSKNWYYTLLFSGAQDGQPVMSLLPGLGPVPLVRGRDIQVRWTAG